MPSSSPHLRRRRRGSVLSLSVLIAVVVSGTVGALAWVAAVQSRITGSLAKTENVFMTADAGAQRVMWYLRHNPAAYHSGGSLVSPFTGAFSGTGLDGTYRYQAICTLNTGLSTSTATGSTAWPPNPCDDSLRIVSTGTYIPPGLTSSSSWAQQYTITMDVYPPAQGVPTFASGGNWDNKNTTVVGDIQTAGDFTNSGGSGSVTGNVFYSGNITGSTAISGVASYVDPANATDPHAFQQLDWTTVKQRLNDVVAAEGATATYSGTQTKQTFDFGALPGSATSEKVYMVVGDVVDPAFKGSGTLYVVGSVSFSKNVTLGDSSNPINIVTVGDVANISFSNRAVIYGSLYAQGNWDRAQTDVYGMVYVQGLTRSNMGSSSLDASGITVPFFDTRAPAGSAVTTPMRVARFSAQGLP